MTDASLLDRFVGCLVGGAVGDALGYPIEFDSYQTICHRFGPQGIQDYWLEATGGTALFSDDTQMTLFTAEGLLKAGQGATRAAYTESLHKAYLDWLRTQSGAYVEGEEGYTWLAQVPELYARRAPGNTCLSALRSGKIGLMEEPLNNSKGCGGVMRVAPCGLFFEEPGEAAMVAAIAAAITHGHPMGYIPAAALAYLVNRCVLKESPALEQVVRSCIGQLPGWFASDAYHADEMAALLDYALELAHNDDPDHLNIRLLGEGWVGEEALAITVYAAVRYEGDFTATVRAAVNHSGDVDSTGAIAGNICGAQLGAAAIEERWTQPLELRDTIERVARELYLSHQ